jgi:membrane-associated phospholipid phosphatase
MKARIIISFMSLLLLGSSFTVSAQTLDKGIWELRNNAIPDFHYSYDDYLQYAPAAVMVGMKACGYESRSSWGRMLVSDAFSAAIMAGAVNAIKYSVGRLRPDGSRHNSFPSGHTATAFMTASMLHKEYGWRSPWFSIGGYTAAAVTGVSRICNNKHWLTDVVAGAAIGIGAVELGYFLTDLIFKEKHLYDGFEKPRFFYDPAVRHYNAELIFGRRFIIGAAGAWQPVRGGLAGLSVDIPLIPGLGITGRASANSLTYSDSSVGCLYSAMAGGFYNLHFAKILELQAKVMAGYAWGETTGAGASLGAGFSLSMITGNNFKIKAFAELESMDLDKRQPWLNTVIVGFGTGWFW